MTRPPLRTQKRSHRPPLSALPAIPATLPGQLHPADMISHFNAMNRQHEDLWTRSVLSARAARRLAEAASQETATAEDERQAHLALLAEDPDRRAPRARQLAIAGVTLSLDAVACDFAAQAIGNGQLQTLAWTALFLAVLAGGELALDFYADRHRGVWRAIAAGLGGFVAGLGALRYTYLVTVGPEGPAAALLGAALFTVATMLFVLGGYWALRRAETPEAGKARRRARRAARRARAASERAGRGAAKRDRLIDAYLVRIKASRLPGCSPSQLAQLESAVRAHLMGQEQS